MRKKEKTKKTLVLLIFSILIIFLLTGFIFAHNRNTYDDTSPSNSLGILYANFEDLYCDEYEDEELHIEDLVASDASEKTNNTTRRNNASPFFIRVNTQANVVTIFGLDDEGNHTVPVRAMLASTGPRTAVYNGRTFTMPAFRSRWLGLFGGVHGMYATQIVGHILFHSVPFTERGNNGSLQWWEFDRLGTSASAGCVRLTVADARWIFHNIPAGTRVEFYASSNPGPLGRPFVRSLANAPEHLRGFDPTDPSSNNPWRNYCPSVTITQSPPPQQQPDNNNDDTTTPPYNPGGNNYNNGNDDDDNDDTSETPPENTDPEL